jgi:hypothetical protein
MVRTGWAFPRRDVPTSAADEHGFDPTYATPIDPAFTGRPIWEERELQ